MTPRSYLCDSSWERFGNTVLAGSPFVVFRTTDAGGRVLDALEAGEPVADSKLIDRLLDAGAVHPAPTLHPTAFTLDDVTVVTPQLGGAASADGRIVVDDGSQPPIQSATLRLEINRGPGGARNAARPLVDTPLVAFVDADVELLADVGIGSWLDALLPHFDDPSVGLVAPRVCGEVNSPLDLGDTPARIRAGTRVSYVPAAAIVIRAAAFDQLGGFDEQLRFGEDVDLVWRLDQAGWRCRYEPTSTVWHAPRTSVAGRLRQHASYGTAAAPLPPAPRPPLTGPQQRLDRGGVGSACCRSSDRFSRTCSRHCGPPPSQAPRRPPSTLVHAGDDGAPPRWPTVRDCRTSGVVAHRCAGGPVLAPTALGRPLRDRDQSGNNIHRHGLRLGCVVRRSATPNPHPAAATVATLARFSPELILAAPRQQPCGDDR